MNDDSATGSKSHTDDSTARSRHYDIDFVAVAAVVASAEFYFPSPRDRDGWRCSDYVDRLVGPVRETPRALVSVASIGFVSHTHSHPPIYVCSASVHDCEKRIEKMIS